MGMRNIGTVVKAFQEGLEKMTENFDFLQEIDVDSVANLNSPSRILNNLVNIVAIIGNFLQ